MNALLRLAPVLFISLAHAIPIKAEHTRPDEDPTSAFAARSQSTFSRMRGERIFGGLELYWRNLYALSNIQSRYISRDPDLATQAERIRVGWERRFAPAVEAMMQEGENRDAMFSQTFAKTRESWREEETSTLPDAEIAEDFVARAGAALDGDYYTEGIAPLLTFVPEYRLSPHKEFDDNYWIVPDAFVIERKAVTEDRGGITSAFNGTAHSPWVWIKQPMSWGNTEVESRLLTHDANEATGRGFVGVALLAEALSPLQLNGIDNPEYRDAFMEVLRTNSGSSENVITGPWSEEPLKQKTRDGRTWYTYRLVSIRDFSDQSKLCVVIDFHVTIIDGWLQYIGTRFSRPFPIEHEISVEDAQAVMVEMKRYEPLFQRMVDSAEIETYTESKAGPVHS